MKKTSSFKSEYKYGFAMPEKYEYKSKRGLNEDTIRDISKMKGEPDWMLQFRLSSYKVFKAKKMPSFGGDLSKIDFDNLFYYIKSTKGSSRKWSDLPPEIKETYDRLGIPEAEKALLAGVKAQYESEVVYGSLLKDLSDKGVIFTDTDTALKKYPDLFRKYFATVIPPGDNKFSALNSAVWSGGSFIYVPKNVHIDLPLQTYFRINSSSMGQFERTLIIVDEGASVTYAEGCHKGGSKVHTIEGLKNIEDIKIGDFVLTHKGRFKQVTNTIKRPYKGKIYNLRLEGDGNSHLKVTEEHPFLYSRRRVQEYKNKVFNKEWRPISGIRKYDYLMMPVRKSDFEAEAMGRTIPFGKNGFQKLKINIPLDEKFFKLLGYFYAEGTVQKEHYLSLTFHKDENEYLNEVISLMEEIFHKKPLVDKVRNNGIMIRLSSTLASRFIAQEFGSTLKTKHIPEYLFHASKKALSALICGMWNGDGSYDKKANMFRFNSISSNLAYGYRDILSILGIKSIIFKTKRSGNRHDMYTVTIVRSDNHLFSKIVGIESHNGSLLRSSSHLDKNYSYFCIKSIKITEEETEVYNLSVEEDESYVCEGVISHNCSSPVYSEDSLHSAVVEIIALKGARVRYLTVQNWFNDVYNLVTKRAVAHENAIVEWIDGNIGSKVTMKYPSVILKGKGAHGEVLSLAMSKGGQHQDTGGKMIHLASNTSSIITSKSISLGGGRTSYRGLVKVAKDAKNCKVKVNCDALILDPLSRSDTYPYMEINNKNVSISHEATVSKLDKSQIFYLMSKGLSEEEASAMIVSGFIEPIVKHLPMEYAVELNRLIDMEMEGSVG